MDEILRNFFVSRILVPSLDVMLVNYSLVNEKMIDKVNIKIVSTMLNEVRSILADKMNQKLSNQLVSQQRLASTSKQMTR